MIKIEKVEGKPTGGYGYSYLRVVFQEWYNPESTKIVARVNHEGFEVDKVVQAIKYFANVDPTVCLDKNLQFVIEADLAS